MLPSNPDDMNELHHVTVEADDGMDILFVCPVEGCGRRVVLRRSGDLIVLDKGDFYALHVGGTSGLEISPTVPRDHQASA
jgi:ABC-type iron transport system FetAB ATPase subunit